MEAIASTRRMKTSLRRAAFLVACCCIALSPSHSAEIVRLGEYPYMSNGIPHFLLKGQINTGDVSKVMQAIKVNQDMDLGSSAVVSFDSPGGNMEEGIKIGNFLAENAIATIMRKGEKCVSACALAFLGGRSFWPTGGVGMFLGRYLEPGAQLGFHSTTFDGEELEAFAARGQFTMPVEMTRISLKTLAGYLEESGVSSSAIIDVLGTSISSMKYISSSNDLFSFNINTTPVQTADLNVRDAIYSACAKMLAAYEKTRVGMGTELDPKDYDVHGLSKDDFFGFGLPGSIYNQFACGVHLTKGESARYRAKRANIAELEKAIGNKIARFYGTEEAELKVDIVASDDGGESYRIVSSLTIRSGPWSIVRPWAAGVRGFVSYYPLAYWVIPGDTPIDRLKSAQDDWSKK